MDCSSQTLSKQELAFAEKITLDFFLDVQSAWKEFDQEVLKNGYIRHLLSEQFKGFLCDHLINFDKVFSAIFRETPAKKIFIIDFLVRSCKFFISKFSFVKSVVDSVLKFSGVSRLCERTNNLFIKIKIVFFTKGVDLRSNKSYKASKSVDIISILSSAEEEKLKELSAAIVKENYESIVKIFQDIILFNASESDNKCLVISGAIPPTWQPTFNALNTLGWQVAYLIQHDMPGYSGYGCLPTSEIVNGKVYVNNFLGAMIFAASLDNDPVLISGECYHFVDFHADRCVRLNLTLSSILKSIKKNSAPKNYNLILLMYDGLKPVSKSCIELNEELSKYYVRLLNSADKIIFNSNAEPFGVYIENTYNITPQRLHFLRYSEKVDDLDERYSFGESGDEFHIVTITATFDICVSRLNTHKMVRCILEQGMHFHSYAGEPQNAIDNFLETVKPQYRKFLHIHPLNRNQEELVRELHRYHVGFNGSDHLQFSEGIVSLKDRKYADGVFMYMQSTYATSFLVYASAGLPILVPRFANVASEYFGKFSIPISLSEFTNIKSYLKAVNLQKLCSEYKELQPKGRVSEQITRLVDFLNIKQQNNKTTTGPTRQIQGEMVYES